MKPAKLISAKERSRCHRAELMTDPTTAEPTCLTCRKLCDVEVTLKVKLNKDSVAAWKQNEVRSADDTMHGTRAYWKQVRLGDIGIEHYPTVKMIADCQVTQELLRDCKDIDELMQFIVGRIDQTIENWLGQEKVINYTVPYLSEA